MKTLSTLRAQVTVLLVVAMLVVVVFANAASFFVAAPPWPNFTREIAEQLAFTVSLAEQARDAPLAAPGRMGIHAAPPDGRLEVEATRRLADELARMGETRQVEVLQAEDGRPPVAAISLTDGRWLVQQVDWRVLGPPGAGGGPPGRTLSLATWLALLTAGTALAVVVAVRRLMKPLSLIEDAAARIGPGGEPPVLKEEGPTEVRAAAAAINRLSARLKGAMESRMRIVAAAAHDLRTPLTRMRLRAEFLPEDEEREQWLRDLAELDRIADSAIRLVREEVEGTGDEPVRLDDLVRAVVAEVGEMGLPARLVVAGEAPVLGRPLALRRAVRNLVVNAASHGGGARVSVRCDGARAVLAIEDSGPGIPEALMGQVFEPFFRVDPARQTKIPGAGLGLAIAHEIIAHHGGRLALANRPEGGLLQTVELPAVKV